MRVNVHVFVPLLAFLGIFSSQVAPLPTQGSRFVAQPRPASRPASPNVQSRPASSPRLHSVGDGRIEGSVAVLVGGNPLFLTSVPVFARETTTLQASATVLTDLNGWFRIPEQPSGTYELHVDAPGFAPFVSPTPFTVGTETVYLTPINLTAQARLVTGRVRLTDFSPSSFINTFFGIDVRTNVRLVDSDNVPFSQVVDVNGAGEFAIGGAPLGSFTLRANLAGVQGTINVNTASAQGVEVVVPNSQPIVRTLIARVQGQGVRRVRPGTDVVVTVQATDPDAQSLHYEWKPTDGVCTSVDAPSVAWQLPNYDGVHRMDLLVSDGHSYVLRTLEIVTGPPEEVFTGTVVSGSTPIASARVAVNQSITTTGTNGYFKLVVPEASRYVVSAVNAHGQSQKYEHPADLISTRSLLV